MTKQSLNILTLKYINSKSVFSVDSFTIDREQNKHRCPSSNEWLGKLDPITLEFYSTVKKNKPVQFIGKQMELETVLENSRPEK